VSLGSVAIRISRDLKEVVFVGAFAVICHIGPYRRTVTSTWLLPHP